MATMCHSDSKKLRYCEQLSLSVQVKEEGQRVRHIIMNILNVASHDSTILQNHNFFDFSYQTRMFMAADSKNNLHCPPRKIR